MYFLVILTVGFNFELSPLLQEGIIAAFRNLALVFFLTAYENIAILQIVPVCDIFH